MAVAPLLIGHFRDKLYADKADFLVGVVVAQFLNGRLQVVCFRISEILVYLRDMIIVHHVVNEIIDV